MLSNRLENNRKIYFLLNQIYHFLFSEKFSKKIKFDFDKRDRITFIRQIIKRKKYSEYLEIGCHNNEVFDKIDINKIGVDPISGGNVRGTSDDFFKMNKKSFDCIFIDGLHEYKQVKKDVLNSLKFLNKNGIIILHDCLPPSISHQRVPRTRYTWNGDVWKAIVELRTWDHVDTYTVLADQGLGIVLNQSNTNKLRLDFPSFDKLKYQFFFENYKLIMRTISYDESLKILS